MSQLEESNQRRTFAPPDVVERRAASAEGFGEPRRSSEERSRAAGRITRAILARAPTAPRRRGQSRTVRANLDNGRRRPTGHRARVEQQIDRRGRAHREIRQRRSPRALARPVRARRGDAEAKCRRERAGNWCAGTRTATVEPPPSTPARATALRRHHDRQRPGQNGARQLHSRRVDLSRRWPARREPRSAGSPSPPPVP